MYKPDTTFTLWRTAAIALVGSAFAWAGGPLGGSFYQTMRIHVSATADASCTAIAKIHNGDLLPAMPDHRFDLAPGQASSVDLNLNRLAERPGKRVELLPYIQTIGGRCQSAVEILENVTGRTISYLPNAQLDGQPDVGIPPIPVSRGQFVRFGAARGFDPQPDPPKCAATLAFTDAKGNTVGKTSTVDLKVGQFEFLDLNPNLLLPAVSIVQPKLLLPASGGSLRGCTVTVQVFDPFSGWTTLAVNGN